ncbi:hypothetical protein [Planomonospora sp. ID82291]|uniref:hypothetical protein n=1 Tax=Planomonospora sp. ID82291 TaxID=2738136 RepID=UPI0018C42340|nr:hypothetical protein [Planomonospora sp. ID82291]MBG0818282.1 hypothetical protein [Planomonospora sp. ID82291]
MKLSGVLEVVGAGVTVAGAGGLLYGGTVTWLVLVSVLARSAVRRRDARATLGLLLRQRAAQPGANAGPVE